MLHVVDDGAGQQLHPSRGHRLPQRRPRVVLGADGADGHAARAAAARAPVPVGGRVAAGRGRRQPRRGGRVVGEHGPVEAVADHAVAVRRGYRPHRVLVPGSVGDAVHRLLLGPVAGDPDEVLGLPVVRLDVVVAQRPVEAAAVGRAQAEVGPVHADGGAHPVVAGAPGEPLVGAGEGQRARGVLEVRAGGVVPRRHQGLDGGARRVGAARLQRPRVGRVGRRRRLEGGEHVALDVVAVQGVEPRPRLEHQHPPPRPGQQQGHVRAREARADDGHVVARRPRLLHGNRCPPAGPSPVVAGRPVASSPVRRPPRLRPAGRLVSGPPAASSPARRPPRLRPAGRLVSGPPAASSPARRPPRLRPAGRLVSGPPAASSPARRPPRLRPAGLRPAGRLVSGPPVSGPPAASSPARRPPRRPAGRHVSGPPVASSPARRSPRLRPAGRLAPARRSPPSAPPGIRPTRRAPDRPAGRPRRSTAEAPPRRRGTCRGPAGPRPTTPARPPPPSAAPGRGARYSRCGRPARTRRGRCGGRGR